MSEPLISVIMPCYNHARFLPEAVASLQAQVYEVSEQIGVLSKLVDEITGGIKTVLRATA